MATPTASNPTTGLKESGASTLSTAASVSAWLTAGLQHQQAGQWQQAAALYRRVLQREPQNAAAVHLLGLLASDRGQYEQAVTLLRQSIQYEATVPSTYNHLGNVLKGMGHLSAAVIGYQEALSLKPDYAEAHNNLGTAHREQGKDEGALTYYRDALRCQPDYVAAIISNLDLIVTVDTTVAHLASAMGKPVWTLLPFIPDWRWMMHRSDCPWHPQYALVSPTQSRRLGGSL